MSEFIGENCGVSFGYSLHDVYNACKLQQHRGRDAAGIAARGKNGVDVVKWSGKVSDFPLDTLYRLLPPEKYDFYAGHTRYATRGREDKVLEDAHPHVIGGQITTRNNHIIIRNATASIVHNGQVDIAYLATGIDETRLTTGCDSEALLLYQQINRERQLIRKIPGAYSAIIFERDFPKAIALRDRHGIKPLWKAEKDGKFMIASETYALQENGARVIGQVKPGSALYLNSQGASEEVIMAEPRPRFCFFEINYLQDDRSEGVRLARTKLGKAATEIFRTDIDIITFTPRCPEFVARGYADEMGKSDKFAHVFYKRKSDRSFMQPNQGKREASIHDNLFILDNVDLAGKTVAVFDDSLVRATVIKDAVAKLKSAGASKVYYILATPPVGVVKDGVKHGCLYGVDMPPEPSKQNEFGVRKYGDGSGSSENIRQIELATNTDKIVYITEEKMFPAIGLRRENACYFCIGGPKPF